MSPSVRAAPALVCDAARKALTAVLENQGLRPAARGGHLAAYDAVRAQLDPPPGKALRPAGRMRRQRNDAEYPPSTAPAPTAANVREDIPRPPPSSTWPDAPSTRYRHSDQAPCRPGTAGKPHVRPAIRGASPHRIQNVSIGYSDAVTAAAAGPARGAGLLMELPIADLRDQRRSGARPHLPRRLRRPGHRLRARPSRKSSASTACC